MQEEVENRTVNLAISTTKLTFRAIVNGYNAWKRHHQAKVAQKTAQLTIGKQSIKELMPSKFVPVTKMSWVCGRQQNKKRRRAAVSLHSQVPD